MAKRAGIPWNLILSAELSGHYKPDEEAYLTAVDYLGLQPAEVMMVAAHERDLMRAARQDSGPLTPTDPWSGVQSELMIPSDLLSQHTTS